MHVRQAEVPPLISVDQPFVVQPQQVQDGGLQVMHVDRRLDDAVAELISLAVDMPGPNAAPAIQMVKQCGW